MASLTTKIRNFMQYKYTLDSRTVAGVRKGGGGGKYPSSLWTRSCLKSCRFQFNAVITAGPQLGSVGRKNVPLDSL